VFTPMPIRSNVSALNGIFCQLCPRCRAGKIFRSSIYRSFPKMHERCPVCDRKFHREPGYFLGAMYISYGLALAAILTIAFALWLVTHWRIDRVVIWAIILFLPLVLPITLVSRVLWIYLDQAIDPEK
jgi:uncharacterized protein (DUF983 family)